MQNVRILGQPLLGERFVWVGGGKVGGWWVGGGRVGGCWLRLNLVLNFGPNFSPWALALDQAEQFIPFICISIK